MWLVKCVIKVTRVIRYLMIAQNYLRLSIDVFYRTDMLYLKGGNRMKKLFWGVLLLALVVAVPIPTMARVDINIGIALPPPVVFAAPPDVVVLPDTPDVYAVPDIDADLFFWNGWWWRLWEGRWYRSHYYNRSWAYYDRVPSFYFDVDPGWRTYYRNHDWHGRRWNYERIPDRRLKQNWKIWHYNRHWEKQGTTWGVQGYQTRPRQQKQELRQQRQKQYQQRPEVQRHQQQMRERQKQQQHPESKGKQHQGNPQYQKSHGGPE
jgi:hypothetical protein